MSDNTVIKRLNIPYPAVFESLKVEIGAMRTLFSQHIYKKGSEGYRGDDEKDIQELGILGELIVRDYLCNKIGPPIQQDKVLYKIEALIEKNPIPSPDLILGENKMDIKATNRPVLQVNQKAYKNPKKKVSHFWFVNIKDAYLADHYIYPFELIKDWEVKVAHTPYYNLDLPYRKS